jgi:hypothetical protein
MGVEMAKIPIMIDSINNQGYLIKKGNKVFQLATV